MISFNIVLWNDTIVLDSGLVQEVGGVGLLKKGVADVLFITQYFIDGALPASAATAKFTFTASGSRYGITTSCSGFSRYVTSYAKVANNGTYTQKSTRGYKSSSATAQKVCTSGTVNRTGWYTTN